MNRDDVMTEPDRFWRGQPAWEKPAAVIDLDAAHDWPSDLTLPACPVIGLGDREASGAHFCDTIIEPPATLDGVLAEIAANPRAAAAIVQLLRIAPALAPEDALVAESFAYAMLQGSAEHRAWMAGRSGTAGEDGGPGNVRIERDGPVLSIVLDRAGSGNAIDRIMRDGLCEGFGVAALDPSIERIFLRAEGKTFSLGADLGEFGTTTDPATANAIRAATLPSRFAVHIADRLEAHVQGACVGAGLEIAAFASRLVACPNAWFQLPELAMGILPGAGGCVSVTGRVGRQRAALLILSGKRLSARRALEWGLVDAIVDDPA
jgi:hypothetical protein